MTQAMNARIDTGMLTCTSAFQEHLRENEDELLQQNIIVRVESIHQAHRTAMCSVHQRDEGLLRRKRSSVELVWRAEQALAPLLTLGFSPMVQVRRAHRSFPTAFSVDPRTWVGRFALRLGYPTTAPNASKPHNKDPFGWKRAFDTSFGTVGIGIEP